MTEKIITNQIFSSPEFQKLTTPHLSYTSRYPENHKSGKESIMLIRTRLRCLGTFTAHTYENGEKCAEKKMWM